MAHPICFVHRGDSFYLSSAISQARSSNPENPIIFLGDRSNSFYSGVEHYSYSDYFEEAKKFENKFTKDYFPNYQHPWILFNYQKYFMLRDFCQKNNIKKMLLIDSDVLVYDKISPYFEFYKSFDLTVSSPNQLNTAQASFSIINDTSIFEKLCLIYEEICSKPAHQVLKDFNVDGLTEMVGLGVLLARQPDTVCNTYKIETDFVINHSIHLKERFEMDGDFMKIYWSNNLPYVKDVATQKLYKTPHIHFHGKGKWLMGKKPYLRLTSEEKLNHVYNKSRNLLWRYPRKILKKFTNIYPSI